MLATSFPIPMLNIARQIREFVGLEVNTVPCTQGAQQGQVSLLVALFCRCMTGLMSSEDRVTGGAPTVLVLL